jgi:hypothetical protein
MEAAGITDATIFFSWLVEEKVYLQGLSKEPPEETLQMDYYRKLIALRDCKEILKKARAAWLGYTAGVRDQTNALERAQRHVQENKRKILADVQALETKLNVTARWTEDSQQWKDTAALVNNSKYRKVLDRLEGLLVARIFELSKLNVSGTGAFLSPCTKSSLTSVLYRI